LNNIPQTGDEAHPYGYPNTNTHVGNTSKQGDIFSSSKNLFLGFVIIENWIS